MLPNKMLEESLNKKVSILLKDNTVLEGTLAGFDDYMNMVVEEVEETGENTSRKVGTIVIRGSNVVRISQK
ncbi:MAG: LSM domain-containing protein [Candidatus Thermoplasmatota archaeon]|jgi:small nuclear ribonucleoprotein|nr:LSM domain-containing protein [Candidatus Thermoplasmatota archaeon]MCL5800876.1 LSM domain-containing protein [Candidatus Thermoplasmatota archaeon]